RVADAHEALGLLPVLRADVDVEVGRVERLALLAAAPLLVARDDEPRQAPVARQDLDALREQHLRIPAAEAAHRETAVVADVRDNEPHLVDVADEGKQGATARP